MSAGQRAFAVAIALLANSLMGLALGPFLIGMLSDALNPQYGTMALNYSVLTLCASAAIIASLCYFWTAKSIPKHSTPEYSQY